MSERKCENGDCSDHYGDEAAWCLNCRGLLSHHSRGTADDILNIERLLIEHGYNEVGETLADCIRVVLLDKEKASELLGKMNMSRVDDMTTCLYPLSCPCENEQPNPCPKCGAIA